MKYFNKKIYKWDFAVHRQGYYDYNKKIYKQEDLKPNHQYLFIKCKNKQLLNSIKKIDFNKLAKQNATTILGFSNSDFYEEFYSMLIKQSIDINKFFISFFKFI